MKDNPLFLIVLGPTASGKGSLPKKVSKYLGKNKIFNNCKIVKIIIDNLVEQSNFYKKFVLSEINSYNSINKVKNSFIKPTDKKLKMYSNAYYRARKMEKCKNNMDYTCDELNDIYLENAVKNGDNIIFETNGTSFPYWIFKTFLKYLKKYNYEIIFAWAVVSLCKLLKRNKLRALKKVVEFMKNESKPAPRLPDITIKHYKNLLKKIIDTFYKSIENGGYIDTIDKQLQTNPRILVFDTDRNDINVLFDNTNMQYKDAKKAMDKYKINELC